MAAERESSRGQIALNPLWNAVIEDEVQPVIECLRSEQNDQ